MLSAIRPDIELTRWVNHRLMLRWVVRDSKDSLPLKDTIFTMIFTQPLSTASLPQVYIMNMVIIYTRHTTGSHTYHATRPLVRPDVDNTGMKVMMRSLANIKSQTAALVLIVAPAVAYADEATGTLEVRSEVGAVCEIQDLNDLTVNFDNEVEKFSDLELATMTFNIACTGSPTVNNVEFSEGENYDAPSRGIKNQDSDVIEYRLYAKKGDGTLDNNNFSNETPLAGDFNDSNVLNINEASVTTQAVTVGVSLRNVRAPFSSNTAAAPVGEYSDNITVTVTYSG